jgi:CheY-like chemotaxis protein
MLDGNPDCSARLLIVDDEPAIRTVISQVLTGIGYQVRSAEDGISALAEIRNQMPDIVLSDLNMPGMSGFELISIIHCSYPSIQVIAMSGAFSGEEAPSGLAADAFYQKGCGPGSLLKIIRALPRLDRISYGRAAAPETAWN